MPLTGSLHPSNMKGMTGNDDESSERMGSQVDEERTRAPGCAAGTWQGGAAALGLPVLCPPLDVNRDEAARTGMSGFGTVDMIVASVTAVSRDKTKIADTTR
jgi:hypothetical protein